MHISRAISFRAAAVLTLMSSLLAQQGRVAPALNGRQPKVGSNSTTERHGGNSVTASYSGDNNYSVSTASVTVMVTPPASTSSYLISTVAGNGVKGFGGDGGPATAAALYYPYGVAVDGAGNLFVADSLENRIRKVTLAGTISTVAGNGGTGFTGDGGPAT